MPIDSHLSQADPFSLVPTLKWNSVSISYIKSQKDFYSCLEELFMHIHTLWIFSPCLHSLWAGSDRRENPNEFYERKEKKKLVVRIPWKEYPSYSLLIIIILVNRNNQGALIPFSSSEKHTESRHRGNISKEMTRLGLLPSLAWEQWVRRRRNINREVTRLDILPGLARERATEWGRYRGNINREMTRLDVLPSLAREHGMARVGEEEIETEK